MDMVIKNSKKKKRSVGDSRVRWWNFTTRERFFISEED